MPRTAWQADDAVEPVDDTMMEQFGNWQNFNIASGCEVSYSQTDLTVAMTAGQVRVNGALITSPAGSVTLTPDTTHPCWAWITTGTAGPAIRHGTPAADPSVPNLSVIEPNSQVEVAKVRVEANQTIAANCAVKLSKRMFGPPLIIISSGSGGSSAILNADELIPTVLTGIDDLAVPVAANSTYMFKVLVHYTAAATGDYFWQITAPAGSKLFDLSSQFDLTGTGGVAYINGSRLGGSANGFGTTAPGVLAIHGSAVIGANAGTLQFMHASSTVGGFTKAKSRIELY